MHERIATFIAARDNGFVYGCELSNVVGEFLVEEFPSEALSELRGDEASTGTVFPLDGYDVEHD
jgi:hypothetical protein